MTTDRPVDQWRGAFGAAYIERNQADASAVRSRTLIWGRFLQATITDLPKSVLEVGCNLGINLRALERLIDAELFAVEPNGAARQVVLDEGILPHERLFDADAGKLPLADGSMDMTFTSGVLIHIPPSELPAAVSELYRVSRRYILVSEYFSDQPEEASYRGQNGLLFKRDFGKYMLDHYPDLIVLDFGFVWKVAGASDNGNWWLFRKP